MVQTQSDIFFLDWERPRLSDKASGGEDTTVSVWRTILVANEWAELQVRHRASHAVHPSVSVPSADPPRPRLLPVAACQTYRKTSISFSLFFIGFFLIGLDLQVSRHAGRRHNHGRPTTTLVYEPNERAPCWSRLVPAPPSASTTPPPSPTSATSLPARWYVVACFPLQLAPTQPAQSPTPSRPLSLSACLLACLQNPALRFANTTFWWVLLSSVQLLWRWLIFERYLSEPREQFFVDM